MILTWTPSPTVREGKDKLHHSWGDAGAELEVLEMLWALVRAEKPRVIWESGAGRSTIQMGHALEANHVGLLESYERDAEWTEMIRDLLVRAGIDRAGVYNEAIPDPRSGNPNMVFLDSGLGGPDDPRPAEIVAWLGAPVLLAVHDCFVYERLLREQGGYVVRTPRGLWLRDRRG